MRIQILEDAQQDILDGFYFYESQEKGLGDYFLDSIFADIDSLQLYAGIHPWYFGYQRLLSKRFPFAIYYIVEGNAVQVWSILDCRQHPERIKNKLG